jgi:hypothetical protein
LQFDRKREVKKKTILGAIDEVELVKEHVLISE